MFVDLEKIRAIAERVAKSEGMQWVDVELKGGRSNPLLRIYVDKPDGVSHADCQNVSEQVSAILDVEDPFPGSYVLEVSSPGLDRKLEKPSDFEHFVGRRARLVLCEPLGEQKVWEGRLAGFEAGRVRLRIDQGEIKDFELSNISKAKLVVEF
jgi:ribosome maturation factor RimP